MGIASVNTERLLVNSEKYLDEANTAYVKGDLGRTEEYLFLAADRLVQLIPFSPAELVEARAKTLEEIGDFIEQVQAEKAQPAEVVTLQGNEGDVRTGSPSATPERPLFFVEEKPPVKLKDVAGMSSLKELIRAKLIYPLRDPETTKKYCVKRGAGILLYGPPGTGKSMIARAIAGEFDAAFISIKASDVLDCLYGQTEKNIAALFAQAKKYPAAVIFLDELDGLGADRDSSDSHMRRFINQLLIELQGFSGSLDNIIVLGATNKPWLLDKALIRSGRLDEMFHVPLPDEETRREIWRLNLDGKIKDASVDIETLTVSSGGLSGADIAGICAKANTKAYRRAIQSGAEVPMTQADLLRFFPREPALLHKAELEQLKAFARLYDRNELHSGNGQPTADLHPLCWDQPADVEAFWRLIFAALPTRNGTWAEVAALCQGMDFARMATLLPIVLRSRANATAKIIEPITAEDFRKALDEVNKLAIPPATNPTTGEAEAAIAPNPKRSEESSSGSPVTMQGTASGQEEAGPTAASGEHVPEILKRGEELLEEFGVGLGKEDRRAALDCLYQEAGRCQALNQFDETAFVARVLEIHEAAEKRRAQQEVEASTAEPTVLPLPPVLSQTDQLAAMKILSEFRPKLGEAWKGFVDEIRNARELNLDELRQRVQAIAEEQQKQRERAELERLFQERKPFLEAELVAEIESALAGEQAVIPELAQKIQDKSYEHFVGQILDEALHQLGFDPQRSRKLKRKAFRKITRQRLQVTRESAVNLVRWLDKRLRLLEAEHSRKSQRASSAADVVTDVNELIIPPGLVDFSDVAGMARMKDQLEDAMDLCLDPRKRELYLRKTGHDPLTLAMLLYGAPGTGKTFMARAAAGEFAQKFNFTVMHVPHDAIRSLHYTKKLTRIREIFELAKKRAPTLVVWDEFDELATPPRFSGRKYDADVCATLKQEFEGAIQSDKIVLHLATSNHPWQVDPALLRDGRIGAHVHVLPPDFEARKEFWLLFTENAEIADDLDFDQLTRLTEGMTIAEIREVYKAVSAEVIRAVMRGDTERKFQNDDFLRQIAKQPPRHFKTWLAEGEAAFRGRYTCQRDLFPDLLKDIEVCQQKAVA